MDKKASNLVPEKIFDDFSFLKNVQNDSLILVFVSLTITAKEDCTLMMFIGNNERITITKKLTKMNLLSNFAFTHTLDQKCCQKAKSNYAECDFKHLDK